MMTSDSHFCLKGVEPSVVICCCSPSTSRFDGLCLLRCFSAHHSCNRDYIISFLAARTNLAIFLRPLLLTRHFHPQNCCLRGDFEQKRIQNRVCMCISAGGTGVLLNVDRVAELLKSLGHGSIQVRGLADSGWFLDNKQYRCTDCVDTIGCAPTEAIKRGIRYWGSVVPERCRLAHTGEEWNCFFGYKVYPTLKSPVFVVQWLFDEAQLTVDNIHLTGQPVQQGQWRYIQNLGIELRNTLKDVPAMFAPACLSHEIITRNYWMDVHVKGTSLPRALQCWDRSLQNSLRNNSNHRSPPRACPLHLIDSCPWPHCNPTCPTIRDQMTGQEMSVIQFLTHMGFDVQRMAQQQGMEASTLLGMLNNGN
ncbi:hypothetical protein AMELA_G00134600 [Ameiurus melas]|uniref:Uncharacterized protein n=1 Tax=Ameiurus melas TaxID=219545 RepID=A0A7J6ALJ2_AMEME|nr:hypothetical protein AMELA_G00134600 [Ameiurus melas]